MNCKVFFRILAIGAVVILIAASAYAAEDHLSISPSSETGVIYGGMWDLDKRVIYAENGKFEVTISGTRNSDKVDVTNISYFVSYITGETNAGIHGLTIKATIWESENPGKSTYERKFPIYLKPGLYVLAFQISNSFGRDWEFVDMDGIKYLYVKDPIRVNIENITGASITESDSFVLEGITVPGSTEKYWGTFKWNPYTLSFDLIDAGVGIGADR